MTPTPAIESIPPPSWFEGVPAIALGPPFLAVFDVELIMFGAEALFGLT